MNKLDKSTLEDLNKAFSELSSEIAMVALRHVQLELIKNEVRDSLGSSPKLTDRQRKFAMDFLDALQGPQPKFDFQIGFAPPQT